jgi:hypothetical protein
LGVVVQHADEGPASPQPHPFPIGDGLQVTRDPEENRNHLPPVLLPLHYSKTMRQRFLVRPASHPKFLSRKGCNHLQRETPSYRVQISYGSARFVDLYKKRTSVERILSRLLSLAMQRPTVHRLQAVHNSCTVVHITVLLIALAAHDQGRADKLTFVRSCVPNFMAEA